ncbi:MAG: hypothetical protein JST92_06075 [Deltaproteobacteria bacterium]|nr:hypothetical protein [Deltaproteobacteria bacterium]
MFPLKEQPTAVLSSPPKDLLKTLSSIDAGQVLDTAQGWVDLAARMPVWLALTLVGLAIFFTALGRHSVRPLAGVAAGAVLVMASLVLLAPRMPDSMAPGLLAIIGGSAAIAVGFVRPGVALAVAGSALFGWFGGTFAHSVAQVSFWWGAVPFGLFGFFFGLVNDKSLSHVLPPAVCAAFCVAALVRAAGSRQGLVYLPELAQAAYVLIVWGAMSGTLIFLAWDREKRRVVRVANQKAQVDDAQLRRKLKADRERFEKFLGNEPQPAPAPFKRAKSVALEGERKGEAKPFGDDDKTDPDARKPGDE